MTKGVAFPLPHGTLSTLFSRLEHAGRHEHLSKEVLPLGVLGVKLLCEQQKVLPFVGPYREVQVWVVFRPSRDSRARERDRSASGARGREQSPPETTASSRCACVPGPATARPHRQRQSTPSSYRPWPSERRNLNVRWAESMRFLMANCDTPDFIREVHLVQDLIVPFPHAICGPVNHRPARVKGNTQNNRWWRGLNGCELPLKPQ